MRLFHEIPRNKFHKLYFDNYYTSIPVIGYLAQHDIHSLGIVRRNRIPRCKDPSEKDCNKMKRGESGKFFSDYEGTSISNVGWKDNKTVTFLSSFIGIEPVTMVSRFDKKKKEKIEVHCPAIITQYCWIV